MKSAELRIQTTEIKAERMKAEIDFQKSVLEAAKMATAAGVVKTRRSGKGER